ncbi:triose-phosphate isomerase [Candidatus Woesearchaeota archaeon]|nr:triose-phosphate isomerase [Candidatus Woesearchaeota archaeon]|tara:strand:- start:4482 stop:5147 length:666 start_codon:yes stop_codon:yes gene_type:complete
MRTPVIIVNFKTYQQATGKNAVKLAKACEKVAKESKVEIVAAVQTADISKVANAVKIPVFAQHVDKISYGKNTGFILPESVKKSGASGTLLNHAEHKLDYKILKDTINSCKKLKLTTVVCAANKKEAAVVAKFKPNFIAVEPPELIGKLVSVSKVEPDVVISSIAAIRKVSSTPVLCGAGVANGEDVKKAIELGTKGVLIATAVTKAKNHEAALKGLVKYI